MTNNKWKKYIETHERLKSVNDVDLIDFYNSINQIHEEISREIGFRLMTRRKDLIPKEIAEYLNSVSAGQKQEGV